VSQLGPFALGDRLGTGGQADVHRAVHVPTGTPVAVKRSRTRHAAADLLRELETLADVDHPNVVRLWGAGVHEGAPWFAMELARGTLADVPMDWTTAHEVLAALASALAHVHARGLLHLDLKPANVLVGCDDGADAVTGRVPGLRLSDFGLASRLGGAGVRAGTVGFAAPEQLRGERHRFGPETDLYALGQLGWWLVTGETAFRDPVPAQELRAQLRGGAPPLRPRFPVPGALEAWLWWLLSADPSQRPQRAAEALAGLPRDGVGDTAPVPPGGGLAGSDVPATFVLEDATGTLQGAAPVGMRRAERGGWPPWRVREEWGRVRWLLDGGLGPVTARHPRFVGRTAEREHLWGLLREVRDSGRPRGVVLRGLPGAGTSRLAAWLCGRAHESDAGLPVHVTHTAAGGPGEGLAAALRTLTDAGQLKGEALHQRLREVTRGLRIEPAWTELLHEVLTGDGDPAELATPDGFGERPVVLVIDDARWASPALPVVARLLGRAAPVLVVLVASDGDGPASPALEALGLPELRLGPLALDELDRLEHWTGLSPSLADQLLVSSGGFPGHVMELLRTLDGAGRLRSSRGGFVTEGPLPLLAPHPGLAGAPAAELRALALAALTGRPVDDADRWRPVGVVAPSGQVEDPRVVDTARAALGPAMAGVWAEVAALTPSPAARALAHHRAGRPLEARPAVEEVVWRLQTVDAATVALAAELRDPGHPASLLLPLVVAGRRGRHYTVADAALALLDQLPAGSRELALATELAAVACLDTLPRAETSAMAERAEALFAAVGDAVGQTRVRFRRIRSVKLPAERLALLAPLLEQPAHRRHALALAAEADPSYYEVLLADLADDDPTSWPSGEGHRVLAECASRRGHDDLARHHLRIARQSRRSSQHTWRMVLALSEGDVAYRAGRYDDALAGYLEASEALEWVGLDNTEADLSIAATLLARGDVDGAARRLPRVRSTQHEVTALGVRLVGFAVDLAQGHTTDALARWQALWAGEAAALAALDSLRMYSPLVEAGAARAKLTLPWPG
jgi:hypothetical protein